MKWRGGQKGRGRKTAMVLLLDANPKDSYEFVFGLCKFHEN
jgi:hypothetical protein